MNNNAVPAHAYYGTPQTGYRLSAVAGSRIGRGDKCTGNDDTCGANKVRGQSFCAGHLKKIKSEQEA
jgi:hypothetical protein